MVKIMIIFIGLKSKASKPELGYIYIYIWVYICVYIYCCYISTGWYHKYCRDNETKSFALMVMCLALLPPKWVAQSPIWLSPSQQQNSWLLWEHLGPEMERNQMSMFRRKTTTNNDSEGMYSSPWKLIVITDMFSDVDKASLVVISWFRSIF